MIFWVLRVTSAKPLLKKLGTERKKFNSSWFLLRSLYYGNLYCPLISPFSRKSIWSPLLSGLFIVQRTPPLPSSTDLGTTGHSTCQLRRPHAGESKIELAPAQIHPGTFVDHRFVPSSSYLHEGCFPWPDITARFERMREAELVRGISQLTAMGPSSSSYYCLTPVLLVLDFAALLFDSTPRWFDWTSRQSD